MFPLLLLAAALEAAAPADDRDWLRASDGVLELALALDQPGRPCGGMLTVDAHRRLVSWRGVAHALGCRQAVEAAFEDVKAVTLGPEAGLVVSLVKGTGPRLVLLPRPHAPWFARRWMARESAFPAPLAEALSAADGGDLGAGGPASLPPSAPQVKRRELPADVVADTRMAVTAILDALGRTPAPSTVLRETFYGLPVELTLADLAETPTEFENEAVRVGGRLQGRPPHAVLADAVRQLRLSPVPELRAVADRDFRGWQGQELELTGVLRRDGSHEEPQYELLFWDYMAPGTVRPELPTGPALPLSAAIEDPEARERTVTVIGRYRGGNVHGDLPLASRRKRTDWIIKEGERAAWVTGKPPRGHGFKLTLHEVADTVNWVEVTGRLQERQGITYVRAVRVALTRPPPKAVVKPGRRIVGREGVPPSVVFELPLDGEEAVPLDSRLIIQFSKYMDEESFAGRVQLRYVGDTEPEGAFDRLRLTYDDDRRALIVDPGTALRAGRLECLLLPGIRDADGLELQARRPEAVPPGAVDVLRYEVAAGASSPELESP